MPIFQDEGHATSMTAIYQNFWDTLLAAIIHEKLLINLVYYYIKNQPIIKNILNTLSKLICKSLSYAQQIF